MAREASDLLARIYALTGRFDELAALEGSVTNSPLKRAVGQHWARAKDLQRWALAHPAEAYKCGLYCLDRLTRETQPGVTHPANFLEQESSPRGWSAQQLTDLAGRFGVKVEAVHVPDFARLPLPCVVHLGSEHFVFVAQSVNGFLQVIDPIAETPQWMLPADLAREATGCVLVAGGSARPDSAQGLRSLTPTEAGNFRGRCHGPLPNDRHDPGPCPNPALEGLTDCESCETGPQPADDGSGPCPGCLVGMPYVRVSKPFLNPWVLDRPVSYEPAYGPKVSLDLAYNPRQTPSTYDANVFNAGSTFGRTSYYHPAFGGDPDWNDAQKESGWSSGWGSHAKIGTSGNDAEVLLPGGRWADFDFSADPARVTSAVNYRLNIWLTKTLSGSTVTGLVLHFRNGSKVEYGTSKNGRWFMTARKDPQGRATTFTYDTSGTIAK